MAYSRWSNSEWYTYWSGDYQDVGDELLCIHKRGGEAGYVVWDEHSPAEMTDADIADVIPWDEFSNVTPEQRNELIGYVRMFFEDVWQEKEDMKLIDQVEWRV